MNEELAKLAASQFALFTTTQAAKCGVNRSKLHREVQHGRLWTPQPAVFVLAGSPPTWEQSLLAALLTVGPQAVASHRSAARLWQLGFTDQEHLEITVPRNCGARPKGVVVHRSDDIVHDHTFRVGRFGVTNPLRTLVDLGAVAPETEVEDALDRGLAKRLYTVPAVEWMLHELTRPGRSGCGPLGRVLDERALGRDPSDSLLEPRMARLFKAHRLPQAIFHYVLRDENGRFLAELDFGYPPPLRLGIEVDGWGVHSSPRQMSKDFVRQNGLAPYLWRVLRFTWEQVVGQPAKVAEIIRRTLAALSA